MSYRVLQAQKMVTTMAGSLRRNSHRLFCSTPPPTDSDIPRRLLSNCKLARPGYRPDFDRLLRDMLSAKYGASAFPPIGGARTKRAFYDTSSSSDDDSDSDEQLNHKHNQTWRFKVDDDALYLKMDMPGVDKENVKVYVEGSTQILKVKGMRKFDSEFGDNAEDNPKSYFSKVSLMPIIEYKIDKIKAEMKDGVLKVTVPKVKDEERMDLLHVQVD